MLKIVHISDLHIGQPGAVVATHRLVDAILREKPDVVVISGDITDDGTPQQYKTAYDALLPLVRRDCLLLVVPGNHDCGRSGIWYEPNARERFGGFVEQLTGVSSDVDFPFGYSVGDWFFVCLDTCTPPTAIARGNVGYLQRQRLARDLEAARRAGRGTVVIGHHHPFDTALGLALGDSSELLATLSHRTDLLLFGHKHVAGEWSDVYGVRRVLASCKSTESLRYRLITLGERLTQRWVSVQ